MNLFHARLGGSGRIISRLSCVYIIIYSIRILGGASCSSRLTPVKRVQRRTTNTREHVIFCMFIILYSRRFRFSRVYFFSKLILRLHSNRRLVEPRRHRRVNSRLGVRELFIRTYITRGVNNSEEIRRPVFAAAGQKTRRVHSGDRSKYKNSTLAFRRARARLFSHNVH